jgi:uroporphyrinogen decarboxylase
VSTMSSRDRILASIRHEEPDRVPIDLGSTASSGISAIAYANLKTYLGLDSGHTRVYEPVQELAEPEEAILDRFRVDAVDLARAFTKPDGYWHDFDLPNGPTIQYPSWFVPIKQPDGSLDAVGDDGTRLASRPLGATFFDQTVFPYVDGYPSDYRDLSTAIRQVQWAAFAPNPWDHSDDGWDQLREKAVRLREDSGKALILGAGCNLFEWGCLLRRNDEFLMDLVEQPNEVERFLDALVEIHLVALDKICSTIGDVVDVIRLSDDLGTNDGPFMSPEMYRRYFKPRHAVLCQYIKTHSQMHPLLHSCGSIYDLIPDLIDAGFEILNPVQLSGRNMDPDRLKREFGRDITFWGGGADTRQVLNRATPSQVKDHVRMLLEVFSPGGGYVLAATHNILSDVPPENIVAMFEAAEEFNNARASSRP